MKTLKEKLELIIEKNGSATYYMSKMLDCIIRAEKGDEDFEIRSDHVIQYILSPDWDELSLIPSLVPCKRELLAQHEYSLEYCIGSYITNKNLLKQIDLNFD